VHPFAFEDQITHLKPTTIEHSHENKANGWEREKGKGERGKGKGERGKGKGERGKGKGERGKGKGEREKGKRQETNKIVEGTKVIRFGFKRSAKLFLCLIVKLIGPFV